MRSSILFVVGAMALAPLVAMPAFAADDPEVMAVVRHYDDAFNKGDMKAWNALCSDQAIIIDDFAPHVWQGANACGDWWNSFTAASRKAELSGMNVGMGKPWHVTVEGDSAYVVEPTTYSYKEKGKPALEHGVWTFALQKQAAGWRITGWAWAQH